jgi:hypothetical protein
MHQMWKKISPYYQILKKNPPANAKELCSCINNDLNKDILNELDIIAEYMRTSGLIGNASFYVEAILILILFTFPVDFLFHWLFYFE